MYVAEQLRQLECRLEYTRVVFVSGRFRLQRREVASSEAGEGTGSAGPEGAAGADGDLTVGHVACWWSGDVSYTEVRK